VCRLEFLIRAVGAAGSVTVLRPQAGWCATLGAPAVHDDEALAVELLREDGVALHPGFLFDFPGDGFFVLSLLPEPAVFDAGVERILARLRAG
jgi:aspartate/methionine/tyrosine aminotransferase